MTPTPGKPTSTLERKDVQKLQRAIIDGLEDVKAQDIQVFDTEHLTSLFERVIVASGTSNRQTKALAASVRDAVRDAGFAKPRIEGEDNGEWIIVDCGAAVAHIMQPTIRQYYHLEELWGDKPVKLKLGAPAPLVKAARAEVELKPAVRSKTGSKGSAATGGRAAPKPGAKAPAKTAARKPKPAATVDSSYIGRVGKTNDWTAKRNATDTAAEPAVKAARAGKPAAKPGAKMPLVKMPLVKVPPAKKAVARKIAAATPAAGKQAARKPAAKKPVARKTATRSS
jgi:ribosome-associated protein